MTSTTRTPVGKLITSWAAWFHYSRELALTHGVPPDTIEHTNAPRTFPCVVVSHVRFGATHDRLVAQHTLLAA